MELVSLVSWVGLNVFGVLNAWDNRIGFASTLRVKRGITVKTQ